ncbi:MAG: thermonuclease family protein [Planctomycetes bacterium]|nr:thermonuclease family protein [Planctomycetota bacterium]
MGKKTLVKLACTVVLVLVGLGIVPGGWGVISNVVLEELNKTVPAEICDAPIYADVVRVVDGDTIEVEVYGVGGDKEMLRLIGVDTPETVHPSLPVQFYGPEATQFTKNLCLNSAVALHVQKDGPLRGKYGRLLVYVELSEGRFLNEEIIKRGFGYSYTKYPHAKTDYYNQLQSEAQKGRRGLWGSVKFEDLPGWLRESDPDILK